MYKTWKLCCQCSTAAKVDTDNFTYDKFRGGGYNPCNRPLDTGLGTKDEVFEFESNAKQSKAKEIDEGTDRSI